MTVIYFDTAPYCAPCRAIKPTVYELASKYGATVIEREPENHGNGTTVLPMLYIESNGNVKKTLAGGEVTRENIENIIKPQNDNNTFVIILFSILLLSLIRDKK